MRLDTKQKETDISVDRTKRDAPTKAETCKNLELASAMRGRAATIVSGIADVASAIPFFGGLWQTAASGITTGILTAQASADIALIEMDCGDIPFDEIKALVKERFDSVDKGIDRNYAALQDISKTISKTLAAVEQTRYEMNNQFERLFNVQAAAAMSYLNSFIQDFDIAKNKTNNYSKANYIANINTIKDLLNGLNDAKLNNHPNALDTMLKAMLDSNGNNVTFSQLYALYSGARTLVSMHLFRYEQYSYIADYYYQIGKLDEFNQQFQKIREVKLTFGKTFDIIKRINDISEAIKEKYFIVDDAELIKGLTEQINDLNSLKGKLDNLKLPIIDTNLITLELQQVLKFKKPTIKTPFGEWESGKKVTYAIQYKNGSQFSNIGEWASPPIVIDDKANPVITLPQNNNEFTRLIFRKFNNENAQLVGVIKDKAVTEFRDINRDLYNAMSCLYTSENEIANISQTLIDNKADIKAAFDQGRQTIHAAAACKYLPDKIIDSLLDMAKINSIDDNGYTPLHIASEQGNSKFVKALCEKKADINIRTRVHKLTPLHLAVRQDDINTIKNLVSCNNLKINIGDDNDMRPLHTAVSRNSSAIVKALLKSKIIDINTKATSENLTPLHMAAIGNFYKIAKVLCREPRDKIIKLNARTTNMLTPLHFAVINGSSDMVDFLIKNKVNVNARSSTDWTPLHYAVSLRKEDIAFKLLNTEGIDVNAKNWDDFTPLHIAAGTGQENVVDMLLNNKQIRINETTNDGLTPLHIASMHTNKNIVKKLISNHSNKEARTKKGLTPLLAATKKGNLEIVKYLIEKQAKTCVRDNYGNDILTLSAANGHLHILDHFIEDNYPVGNLLKAALQNGHLNIVQNIVEEGKVGEICTRANSTMDYKCLLNEASQYKYLNVVDYLLSKDKSTSLVTPAKIAAQHGHVKTLEKYININNEELKPHFNKLMNIAVAYGWYGTVKYLHETQHVSINNLGALPYSSGNPKLLQYLKKNDYEAPFQFDDKNNTLLHYALSPIDDSICINDTEKTGLIAESLINQGFNVNATNLDGLTPMHMAAWSGCLQSVKLLILKKADLSPEDLKGLTPLEHLQNGKKHPKIQELLRMQEVCNAIVKRQYVFTPGHDINGVCVFPKLRNVSETRPLLVAIVSDIKVADVLIEHADLSLTDAMGNTPLHIAAMYNRTKLITKLIVNRVDIEAKNNQGKKAIDYAKKKKYSEIVDLLTSAQNANNKKNNKRIKRFDNEAAYHDIKANMKSADDVFKYIISAGCHFNHPKYNLNPLCLDDLNDKHDAIKIKNANCFDNNLSLGYILLQNYLNKKYPLPKFSDITPEDGRTAALKITQKFEKLLKKLVKNTDDLDFYQLYVDIEKTIRSEKFSNIPIILTQFVKNACAADGDFENELNQEIGKVFPKLY